MLLGEHLGGREHGRLPAAVHDGEHRPQRDQGLARADLSLEEAVHGVFGGQVVEDLLRYGLLALGEGEGQFRVEGVEQAAGDRPARDGRELGVRVPHGRARATWRTKASSHFRRWRASSMSALVPGRWIFSRASVSGTSPRPSRRAGGSGSTASPALGSTASTHLAIFQDSSLAQAG